jgi:thymidylate kinase
MNTFLISFSGLDGAGKTTQIENLRAHLEARGVKTTLLAFWDNVVVLSRYREGFVHKVFKSERGIGAPGKPVNRRDKNVRGWHVNLARHGLYLLDALNLRRVIARARRSGVDVIIMDRYIHDELANLPLDNAFTRLFVRFVAAIAPKPDVAYMLDADPHLARARKPEYPLDFLIDSRRRYHKLAPMVEMSIIPPLGLEEAKATVVKTFVDRWNAVQARIGHDAVSEA